MNRDVNLSKFKELENAWAGKLQAGYNVKIEIEVIYDVNKRPTQFKIKQWVTENGQTTYTPTTIYN